VAQEADHHCSQVPGYSGVKLYINIISISGYTGSFYFEIFFNCHKVPVNRLTGNIFEGLPRYYKCYEISHNNKNTNVEKSNGILFTYLLVFYLYFSW
jgi:hypothetical protein